MLNPNELTGSRYVYDCTLVPDGSYFSCRSKTDSLADGDMNGVIRPMLNDNGCLESWMLWNTPAGSGVWCPSGWTGLKEMLLF